MMKWMPFTFQNFSSVESMLIDWLHDYILFFLLFIVLFVSGVLISLSGNKFVEMKTAEVSLLELIWTTVPSFVLILIGLPSLSILYNSEGHGVSDVSVKIIGHQWYWSYDYCDFSGVEFDSYLLPLNEMVNGAPRLLETDNHLVFPLGAAIRFIITSADVLHSWAMPSLGMKADANPGRMNILLSPFLFVPGLFYGQCSEICGANHSFMPIVVEISPLFNFLSWIKHF